MKKLTFLCFFILLALSAFASTMDINIIYEASTMKVKETVCGWTPNLDKGYMETKDGCWQTRYNLKVPMYGFTFEPKSGAEGVPADTKCAYYLTFFDAAFPKPNMLKTEIIHKGRSVRDIESFYHDRTFQGVVILGKDESIRLSSEKEPSYIIIYVISAIVVALGLFAISRRKRR